MSTLGSPIHNKAATVGGSDGEREASDHERPERMREWIIRMVNSKRFHGLEWLNPEKNVFRVPWIHAKKRGYRKDRDAALFREWALHSGKYRDESDPTVWKINFRCAINGLKDVMEIKDMQSEECRVYKVLPSRCKRRKARRARLGTEPYQCTPPYSPEVAVAPHVFNPQSLNSCHFPYSLPPMAGPESPLYLHATPTASPYHHQAAQPTIKVEYSPEPLPPCSISPALPPTLSMPTYIPHTSNCIPYSAPSYSMSNACTSSTILNEGHSTLPSYSVATMDSVLMQHVQQQEHCHDSSSDCDSQHSPASIVASSDNDFAVLPAVSSGSPTYPSPPYPGSPYASPLPASVSSPTNSVANEGSVEKEIARIVEELDNCTPSPPPVPSPAPQQLDIRVFYGTIPVVECSLLCHNGCRIFFDPRYCKSPTVDHAQRFFGPSDAHQIQLPESHPNHLAKEIFNAMSRGLLIEMENDDIYATPLCRTVVYFGTSPTSNCQPLFKEQRAKVFDYKSYFRPALERYALANGQAPSPYAVFSLGQAWGPTCSVSQNLISIAVCHSKAKHELDMMGIPRAFTPDPLIPQADAITIGKSNISDLEAEAFLARCISEVQ